MTTTLTFPRDALPRYVQVIAALADLEPRLLARTAIELTASQWNAIADELGAAPDRRTLCGFPLTVTTQ